MLLYYLLDVEILRGGLRVADHEVTGLLLRLGQESASEEVRRRRFSHLPDRRGGYFQVERSPEVSLHVSAQ